MKPSQFQSIVGLIVVESSALEQAVMVPLSSYISKDQWLGYSNQFLVGMCCMQVLV